MPKKLKGLVKKVWESKLKQSPKNNKHISYSQLSTFANCQKQWHLTYVKNLAPSKQIACGIAYDCGAVKSFFRCNGEGSGKATSNCR